MSTTTSGSDTSIPKQDPSTAMNSDAVHSEQKPVPQTKPQTPQSELAAIANNESSSANSRTRISTAGSTVASESLREQKKAQARQRILDCAQQLINSEGYSETKMRGVAAAANMSYQTLYNYFPTKGLILQELLTRDLVKLRRETFDSANSHESLNTRVREFVKSYIDAVAVDERHLWKEVCAELLKVTSHHSCFVALLDENALNKIRDLLARAQADGKLDPHVDSNTLAGVLYSLLDATLMRYLVNESITKPQILRVISAQIGLTITPYLR